MALEKGLNITKEGAMGEQRYSFIFGEQMDALPIYEKLEKQILAKIPDVKIKVAKTQITFVNKRGFTFVSFNPCRKAAQRPKVWMTVTFGLGYCKDVVQPKLLRRARNTPLILPAVINKIAELKGISPCEVEKATTENTIRLFSLPIEVTIEQ